MSWRGEKLLLAHLFTHEERWKLRDEYLIHLQERFKRLKSLKPEMKSRADPYRLMCCRFGIGYLRHLTKSSRQLRSELEEDEQQDRQ
jgi:hypothetical protein